MRPLAARIGDVILHESSVMNESDDSLLQPQLRTMQIITGALLLGVLVFLAFSFYSVLLQNGGQGQAPIQGLPVLSLAALAMAAISVPLSIVVPGILTRAALQQIVAGTQPLPRGANPEQFAAVTAKLLAVRQTALIVGLALLDGTALMGCVAYLLERQELALGVVGVAILLMLLRFPTETGVRSWLERQAEVLTDLRQEKDIVRER